MPYAHNGQISQEPVEGGIEIDDAQYKQALDAMLNGKIIAVDAGILQIKEPFFSAPAESVPPSKEERIASLQAAYEFGRDKLNKAWLSAMIVGGTEEVARKSAIQDQMTALDDQLEADIMAVIMEE